METSFIAFSGLLNIDNQLNAYLIKDEIKIQIIDPIFLKFIENDAPFLYEIEGAQIEPPLFSFFSTIIAEQSQVNSGIITEVIFCSSSTESNLEYEWANWVAFEYHKFMPDGGLNHEFATLNEFKDGEKVQGILIFRSEFEAPHLKQAFVGSIERGNFNVGYTLDHLACKRAISFVLHNEKLASRIGSDFTNEKTLFVKNTFDEVDLKLGRDNDKSFEFYEYNKYGFAPIEILCKLSKQDARVIADIKEMQIQRQTYILRWQEQAPQSLKSFLQGHCKQAPLIEIPYFDGTTGSFHLWL